MVEVHLTRCGRGSPDQWSVTAQVANRDVKRLANAAVAPTVTNAVEMGAGRSVAGAVGCSEFFAKRQRVFLDESLKAAYDRPRGNLARWSRL